MKMSIVTAMLFFAAPATAQAAPPAQQTQAASQIVVESYYRVKWGAEDEFKRLYTRNEVALLYEMQREGFVTSLKFDEPYTHFPGEARWTLRATITYRDAAAAVESGRSYDKAFEEARKRLRPDKKQFDAEQARRFALVEDHWDVIVTAFDPAH